MLTLAMSIITGIKNPQKTGIKHTAIRTRPFVRDTFSVLGSLWRRLVSLKRLSDRDFISIIRKTKINKKVNREICEAAVRLFIPIQTLNIPSVKVCIEKYSTVPKSDTTSIDTRATPAIIAGRPRGRLTFQNLLFP